jgi:SPP1 family predicted phage head-tail adaptor
VNVGTMRDQVTIQRYTKSRDPYGQEVQTWADLVTLQFADLHHVSGREAVVAKQMHAEATHKVVTRYVVEVKPQDRILYKGRVFNILDANDVDELHKTYELLCTEVIAGP